MNVVIYARFSSHNQTEQSIEGQLKVCYEYAKRNGHNVIGEYIDRAISGTAAENRPEFLRMIEDSRKQQFEGALVYQLDRFARNRYDSATYKAKLKKNGVRVISAKENISEDASGILMEAVLEGMAEYYSAELSQKIRRGMALNAEKGLAVGGYVCLGYKLENKQFTVDGETAPIVRRIFEMYLNKYTMSDIINYLNQQQIKTSFGNDFNKNSIRRILTNRRYVGDFIYKGTVTSDTIPPIIDRDTFSEVQILMQKNKKAPARAKATEEQYLLTTKLFCGHCKCAMTGISGTSRTGAIHQYYACVSAKRKKCCKKNIPKHYIESIVIEQILAILTPQNIQKIADEVVNFCEQEKDTANLRRLQKLLKENETATANLIKALESGKAVDVIATQLEKRQSEKAQIEIEIAQEEIQYPALEVPQVIFFLEQFANADMTNIKHRQALIDTFVNKIYLYDTDDGKNKKMTVLCNTQNGQIDVSIDDVEGSSMGLMVEMTGVEPVSEKRATLVSPGAVCQQDSPEGRPANRPPRR